MVAVEPSLEVSTPPPKAKPPTTGPPPPTPGRLATLPVPPMAWLPATTQFVMVMLASGLFSIPPPMALPPGPRVVLPPLTRLPEMVEFEIMRKPIWVGAGIVSVLPGVKPLSLLAMPLPKPLPAYGSPTMVVGL